MSTLKDTFNPEDAKLPPVLLAVAGRYARLPLAQDVIRWVRQTGSSEALLRELSKRVGLDYDEELSRSQELGRQWLQDATLDGAATTTICWFDTQEYARDLTLHLSKQRAQQDLTKYVFVDSYADLRFKD